MTTELKQAVKTLCDALRENKEEGSYYYAWQANIAMAFYDSFYNEVHASTYTNKQIHKIANDAAKNFLNLLIHIPQNNNDMSNEKQQPEENWQEYKRKGTSQMRPYIEGEVLDAKISISEADRQNGSPKVGDMIARNPANYEDQWLVSKEYYEANLEPVHPVKETYTPQAAAMPDYNIYKSQTNK